MTLDERPQAPTVMHEGAVRMRLAALVLAHLALCLLPAVTILLPNSPWAVAYYWIAEAPVTGSLMTLAFFAGMGGGGFVRRLLLAALGAIIVTLLHTLAQSLRTGGPFQTRSDILWAQFAQASTSAAVLVGVLGVCFLVSRYWLVVVRPERPDDSPRRHWLKFSVLHLIVAMSLCGVGVTLIKVARDQEQHAAWAFFSAIAVMCGVFFANTLIAALAALGRRPLLPRMAVSLVVSALLGACISLAGGHDRFGWQLIAGMVATTVLCTLMIVASLLVVRSCGYRLIRRPPHTWKRPEGMLSDSDEPALAQASESGP